MNKKLHCLASTGCAFVLLLPLPCLATDAGQGQRPSFSLSGFGTLGAARARNDDAEYVRDLSQPHGLTRHWSGRIDSLAGIQANWSIDESIEGVAQVVSRYRHSGNFRPELMWAFLKLDPVAGVSLRGGRLGTEFYMLADSRLVGYSYLTVRPPGDYYGTLPFSHIDGADAQFTHPLAHGLLRAKGYFGRLDEKYPLADRQWDTAGSKMGGAYLDYQRGEWQWRVAYAQIRFRDNLPIDDLTQALRAAGAAAAANALTVGGKDARFWSVGAVYEQGPWQIQAMLSRTDQNSLLFQSAKAGYVLAGYRLGEVTPYLGYSRVRSSPKRFATGLPDIGPLTQLNRAVAAVLADSHSDQSTLSAGVRWDVLHNVALKAQVDAIRGRPASIFPYRWEKPGWSGHTEIFSLTLDFVF